MFSRCLVSVFFVILDISSGQTTGPDVCTECCIPNVDRYAECFKECTVFCIPLFNSTLTTASPASNQSVEPGFNNGLGSTFPCETCCTPDISNYDGCFQVCFESCMKKIVVDCVRPIDNCGATVSSSGSGTAEFQNGTAVLGLSSEGSAEDSTGITAALPIPFHGFVTLTLVVRIKSPLTVVIFNCSSSSDYELVPVEVVEGDIEVKSTLAVTGAQEVGCSLDCTLNCLNFRNGTGEVRRKRAEPNDETTVEVTNVKSEAEVQDESFAVTNYPDVVIVIMTCILPVLFNLTV